MKSTESPIPKLNANLGMKETKRQIIHLLVSVAALTILLIMSRNWLIGFIFIVLIMGSILINKKTRNKRIHLIDWFVKEFERIDVRVPGWGSACMATGILILVAYLKEPGAIAAGFIVLGLGDGLSTLIGRKGKYQLPWNKNKTLEGTAAFFFGSLPAWIFIGSVILPLAIITALVESVDTGIDDNLLIPIVCVIVLSVI